VSQKDKKYFVKVNGLYFAGFENYTENMTFTDTESGAQLLTGELKLKSVLDAVYERVRFNGMELNKLEVLRVD
jgi:hypothetical protein